MKRSNSSSGRGGSDRKGKSDRSFKPKSSFSKSPRSGASRSGSKPYRSEPRGTDKPDRKSFGDKPERGGYGRSSDKPAGRNFSSPRREGDKPERFKRDGDKPERGSYNRSSDKPAGRSFSSPRTGGDRPDRFKRNDDKPERKPYPSRSEKPERGSGTYLRRKEDRPDRNRSEEGSSERRNTEKPFSERKPFSRSEKTPFREKRSDEGTGSFADKKKRKRIGDSGKSFGRKDERSTSGGYKNSRSTQKDDSPRSFGENKFAKRPPGRKATKSFERRPSGDRPEKPWNRKENHEFYGDRKKKPSAPQIKNADDDTIRLNKFIANAGICSRREADDMIAAGVISVNGEVITELGYKVKRDDNVKYNNESLRSERLVYILLNKPKDFITTTDDPENRKTVMSLIEKACKERVYPVGRLDRNTTGVLLFTNDGDLAKKLTHPSFQVHKIYQAELDRSLKSSDMALITEGVTLDDGFIKPDDVVYTSAEKNIIGMEIHSGKNRIVRRIFEHLGYEVKKLDRVVFAGLTKKDVPRGRWRFLTEMEVANLKMMTGKSSSKPKTVSSKY